MHMALDEVLLERVISGDRRPTLRLWEWIEPVPKPPKGARPETRGSKASTEPGIPRRTLARLIDRLEHL